MRSSALKPFLQRAWDITHSGARVAMVMDDHRMAVNAASREYYESCGLETLQMRKWSPFTCGTSRYVAYDLEQVPRSLRYLTVIGRAFDCHTERNPLAPWRWHEFLTATVITEESIATHVSSSKGALQRLRSLGLERAYLFGTGPSLDRATEFDYSDGYRIVCNTIVKNVELLEFLNPHVIAAGDALYHFSETSHARQFRHDLLRWLQQSTTLFLYPAQYDQSLRALLPLQVHDQLVPIPQGRGRSFLPGLATDFALPNLGNVLNLLLLPIGAYLAHHISLLGFDGRDPNATGFWRNSGANSYPELLEELNLDYPSFRQLFVPDDDPERYVRDVLGDALRGRILELAHAGFVLDLLSPSHLTGLRDLPVI